jgi:Zn-dependent protease with chaperone function
MSGAEDPKKTAPRGFTQSQSPRRTLLEIGAVLLVVAAVILVVRSCSGLLVTTIVAAVPAEVDARIGAIGAESIHAQYAGRDAPTAEQIERVDGIFEELESSLTGPEREIVGDARVSVVADEQVNAFALPGGHVFVLTGLLDRAEGDDEIIRGVLAHELGHAVGRHGVRSLVKASLASLALSFIIGADQEMIAALVAGASELDRLSYSRDMEEEADRFGVELLRRTGHGPEGLARFLEALEAQPVPELLSTHPDPGDRAKQIRGEE